MLPIFFEYTETAFCEMGLCLFKNGTCSFKLKTKRNNGGKAYGCGRDLVAKM